MSEFRYCGDNAVLSSFPIHVNKLVNVTLILLFLDDHFRSEVLV